MPGTQLFVAYTESLARGVDEDADLAVVQIAMHVVGGLPGILQGVDRGKGRSGSSSVGIGA